MHRYFAGVLALFLAGCGSAAKDQLVPLEQVPEPVMEAARQSLPEVTFDQALQRSDGRYEVRGKDKTGKVRDVDISANGEVLEIE